MKKKILLIFTFLTLLIYCSSCTIGDKIYSGIKKVSNTKECDEEAYTGIEFQNLEHFKEGLQDGANINHIKVLGVSETNPFALAFTKNYDTAKYIIENGADPNNANSSGMSLLMLTAWNTDVLMSQLLVKHGAKADKKDKAGRTALEYVVDPSHNKNANEQNIDNIMTLLLKNGAKIRPATFKAALANTQSDITKYGVIKRILESLSKEGYKSGLNPVLEAAMLGKSSKEIELINSNKMNKEDEQKILFYTAAFGSVDAMKLLEAKGIDIKSKDSNENTTLIIAAQYGNLEMVKYLLNKGVIDIEAQNSESNSVILTAILYNQLEVVQYLIGQGAKAGYKPKDDPEGDNTIKMIGYAATNGNIDMMKLLISNGYPINNDTISDAISDASQYNKLESMKYILSIWKNPDIIISDTNSTPLGLNCLFGNIDIVKLLVEHGAKINGIDNYNIPIIIAAKYGYTEVVDYLLKQGADVNAASINQDGEQKGLKSSSVLMEAATAGYLDIVKLLIDNGANVNYQADGLNNDTALNCAARGSSRNIVEYLIKKGANINYQNAKGETPLIIAASWSQKYNIKVLLKHKANKGIKNKDGQTALDIIKEKINKNKNDITPYGYDVREWNKEIADILK